MQNHQKSHTRKKGNTNTGNSIFIMQHLKLNYEALKNTARYDSKLGTSNWQTRHA